MKLQTYERKKQERAKVAEYKERLGCRNPDCKWNGKHKAHQLDFHHVDSKTKLFNIRSAADNRSMEAVQAEIAKCTLVCSNCHRDIHYGDLDASKLPYCPPL